MKDKTRLKERDMQVLDFIKRRIEEGFAPTVREICAEFGFKSTSMAHTCVNNLVEQGLIEKMNNHNRAIKLVGKSTARVPLLGTVTAGMPITAIEDITDYISFNTDKYNSENLFALKIRGESMINVGILHGDLVIVEKTSYAENGQIVVALVDDEEATVKRFYKEKGKYRLQPENDSMEPIIVEQVSILGKVVAVIRYL